MCMFTQLASMHYLCLCLRISIVSTVLICVCMCVRTCHLMVKLFSDIIKIYS